MPQFRNASLPAICMPMLAACLLSLAAPVPAPAQPGGKEKSRFPEWVMQGSKVEDGFAYGVGMGESKAVAAAVALAEMAKIKKTYARAFGSDEQRVENTLKFGVSETYGPISVEQTTESGLVKDKTGAKDARKKARDAWNALEAVEKGDDSTQYVTMTTKAGMRTGKGSYEIEVEMESITDMKERNEEESRVEVKTDNMGVSDLFKEFERQGMKPMTYYDDADGTHFVILRVKAPPAKR